MKRYTQDFRIRLSCEAEDEHQAGLIFAEALDLMTHRPRSRMEMLTADLRVGTLRVRILEAETEGPIPMPDAATNQDFDGIPSYKRGAPVAEQPRAERSICEGREGISQVGRPAPKFVTTGLGFNLWDVGHRNRPGCTCPCGFTGGSRNICEHRRRCVVWRATYTAWKWRQKC